MAVPRPHEILVHVGGDALARYGTFTRRRWRREAGTLIVSRSTPGSAIGRDGLYHTAAVDVPRVQYVDYNADGIRETAGIAVDGARVNRMIKQNDFTSANGWFHVGTPVVTPNHVAVGAVSLSKIQDDDGAASEYVGLNYVSFGDKPWPAGDGNGTKPYSILWTKSDAEAPQGVGINITDTTAAGATRFAATLKADGAGAPVVSAVTGTYIGAELVGTVGARKVYRLYFQTTTITAGNEHVFRVLPSNGSVADTGDAIVGMIQAEDVGAFPSSLVLPISTTAAVARAADTITLILPGLAPIDITILCDFARPVWMDVAGDIGLAPGLLSIGSALPIVMMYCDQSARSLGAQIRDGVTIQGAPLQALPAGAKIRTCAQFRDLNLASGGRVKTDVGSGYGADSSAAQKFAKYGDQVMQIGLRVGALEHLYGVITNILVGRGKFLKSEMEGY
jgi:hypothetical protein